MLYSLKKSLGMPPLQDGSDGTSYPGQGQLTRQVTPSVSDPSSSTQSSYRYPHQQSVGSPYSANERGPVSSKQHRSGDGSGMQYENEVTDAYSVFDVVFVGQQLGMSLAEFKSPLLIDVAGESSRRSRAVVTDVRVSSEAERNGVRIGDVVLSLERNQLNSFEHFQTFLKALSRPLTIQFYRPAEVKTTSILTETKHVGIGILKSIKNQFDSNSFKPVIFMTEEEKAEHEQRREAVLKAAEARSTASDRKLSSKSQSFTRKSFTANNGEEPNDVMIRRQSEGEMVTDTNKSAKIVKEGESQLSAFSPFRAYKSFTGGVGSGGSGSGGSGSGAIVSSATNAPITASSSSLAGSNSASVDQAAIDDANLQVEMTLNVDDALAMLISLSNVERERVAVATQTVVKMLFNLFNNPSEPKFRSIRLTNTAFNSKVGSICGGIELLLAAGYRFDSMQLEGASSKSQEDSHVTAASSLMGPSVFLRGRDYKEINPNGDEFLTHNMDVVSMKRLHYTLVRLHEIIEQRPDIFLM